MEKKDIVVSRTLWQEAWLRFKRNKMAMAGLCFVIILLLISITTVIIDFCDGDAIYRHYVIRQNLRQKLLAPVQVIFSAAMSSDAIFFSA